MAEKKFDNNASVLKVGVQGVSMFLMAQASILAVTEKYLLALAFAALAGVLLITREFILKRKY